jgi:hypothetical protein
MIEVRTHKWREIVKNGNSAILVVRTLEARRDGSWINSGALRRTHTVVSWKLTVEHRRDKANRPTNRRPIFGGKN